MPKFVKQRHYLVMRQQRGLISYGGGKITGQKRNRALQATIWRESSIPAFGHPGTASLFRTGIKIQIEKGDGFTFLFHLISQHIRMPGRHCWTGVNIDAEHPRDDIEHPLDHLPGWEIFPQSLL